MIVKIPVYFEVDIKFAPSKVEEITQISQIELTQLLTKLNPANYFDLSFEGKKYQMKLLTAQQVRNRITGPSIEKPKTSSPKGKQIDDYSGINEIYKHL